MKVSLLQFSFILAASLVAAAGFAQESQPQVQQTIKDYNVKDNGNKDANFTQVKPKAEHELEWATQLNEIHSRRTARADQQCRSCHAETHNFIRESQLLLSQSAVANPLGIEVAPINSTLRAHLNLGDKTGLILSSVPEGSEGAKLGLKGHDVILDIDKLPVSEAGKFNELLLGLQGKKAHLALLRQGKPLAMDVAVPPQPMSMAIDLGYDAFLWADNRYRIGVTLSEADDTLRSHLKLASGEGLVVTEVVDDSPAAKMGVKQHDVLTELDGKRLTTVDGINAQIQELKDKTVVLKLLRSGQEVTCQIAAKKSSEPSARWVETVLVEDRAHHRAMVRWLNANVTAAPAPSAAEELAQLKQQLAEITKTVEKLEAVIAPAAQPAEQKLPDVKNPENPEKK